MSSYFRASSYDHSTNSVPCRTPQLTIGSSSSGNPESSYLRLLRPSTMHSAHACSQQSGRRGSPRVQIEVQPATPIRQRTWRVRMDKPRGGEAPAAAVSFRAVCGTSKPRYQAAPRPSVEGPQAPHGRTSSPLSGEPVGPRASAGQPEPRAPTRLPLHWRCQR